MDAIPPTTLICRNADYTYQSTLSATVHLYTDPIGTTVIVKRAPKKEAYTHIQITNPTNPSIIRLLDVTELSPFTPDFWLVLEHANNGTLRDLLAHARGADGSIPRKIPAAFCFHALAAILNAVIVMQETHGVQHIDLHAGNIVFDMPPGPWPPVVKVIDFGKTFQLPEEEDEDDVPWDEALSPSIGALVRALLAQKDVLEDEFLQAIKPLGAQKTLIQRLRVARANAWTRAEAVGQHVPEWLGRYFGLDPGQFVDDSEDELGDGDQQDDTNDEVDDLIIRLTLTIVQD